MSVANLILSPWAVLTALLIYYLHPYFVTYGYLRGIPGPLVARFSNAWLFSTARRGKRFWLVHQAHQKYGQVIRVQPNHVSINHDDAIQAIYGHGHGFLKA